MVRIRKHASSILSEQPPPPPRAQLKCQLSLSPWDVTPFTAQSQFDYQTSIEHEFAVYTWNKVEPKPPDVASHRHLEVKKKEIVEHCKEVKHKRSLASTSLVPKKRAKRKTETKKKGDYSYARCVKTDGKRWQCKNEAQQGEELCEHHLKQLKSYHQKYYHPTKRSKLAGKAKAKAKARAEETGTACTTVAANKRRNRGRVQSKPADYFYYTGFGPSWRKDRRGGDEIIIKEQLEAFEERSSSSIDIARGRGDRDRATSSSMADASSDHINEGVFYDYDYEDEDDEDEEGNSGRERIRKPVKARSLKSLL